MAELTIKALKACDEDTKGPGVDEEWRALHAFFEDRSREQTTEQLGLLEMGISKNELPMEIPMLRRLIRRLATVYKAPASRWLVNTAGKRLSKRTPAARAYRRMVKKARLNAKLRLTDRYRTLFLQSVVRVYPSDARKGVVLRNFAPYQVLREPSSSDADLIGSDRQFALRLGRRGDREIYEHWTRSGDLWRMQVVDQDTTPLDAEHQPFVFDGQEVPFANPYGVLPVKVFYAEDPDGRPWISPRQSRRAMQVALNAKLNDLMALVRGEAHDSEYFATNRPEDVPDLSGIGQRHTVPEGTQYFQSSKSPKISESIETIRNAGKLWAMAEGLPNADMDESKTILTGAALRVQEGELRELREEQVEFADEDEAELFLIMRDVWNTHAGSWGEERLPEDVTLEVQIADVDTPVEPQAEQTFAHTEIDAGYMHPVQWFQTRDQVDEEEAMRRWEHTQELFAEYPVRARAAPSSPSDTPPQAVGNPGGDRAPIDSPAPPAAA